MKESDQEDVEKSTYKESMIYFSLYQVTFVILALFLSTDKLQTLFECVGLLAIIFILIIVVDRIDRQ